MEIDTSALSDLVDDLARAEKSVLPAIRPIVQKTLVLTKAQLRAEATGVKHAPALPSTITYDTRETKDAITGEIGPRKGGAGSLALLYFGNSKTGPRLKDPVFAMQRNADLAEPFFLKALRNLL